jgi:hypothetical protein
MTSGIHAKGHGANTAAHAYPSHRADGAMPRFAIVLGVRFS